MRKTTVKDELKETDSKIDSLTGKFDEFKNKVYELLDKVMGELKAIREEQTYFQVQTLSTSNFIFLVF